MTDEKKECACCNKTPQWKQDFPIEWEGDHYVTRREMVKFMTLGSALLATANWITAIAGKLLHRGSKAERDIGRPLPCNKPVRGSSAIRPTRTPALPYARQRANWLPILRYVRTCHAQLCTTRLTINNALVCPCHHGAFNIEHGSPIAGPPTRPLPRVNIEQHGDRLIATGLET